MKKINRKGFTLIELLAVIVIMAIIVVVTVPTIINSISDARVSSLHNLAVSTANSYDTLVAQSLIASDNPLKGIVMPDNTAGNWGCLGDLKNANNETLASILGLSNNDLVLTGNTLLSDGSNIGPGVCSSVSGLPNGSIIVLLVAKDGGKFEVSGNFTYAYSNASEGVTEDLSNYQNNG